MSWFFKKDKTESVKPEDVSKVKDPITSIPTLISGITTTSTPSSEYQEKVKGWLVEANEKGLDYFEFSTAIDSLAGQALTEQQKFSVKEFLQIATCLYKENGLIKTTKDDCIHLFSWKMAISPKESL